MKHRTKPIRQGAGAGARPWEAGANPSRRKAGRPRGEREAQDIDFCLHHCPYWWEDDCRHKLSDCKRLAAEIKKPSQSPVERV